MGAIVVAVVLAALLLAVGLAFAWQERRAVPEAMAIYGVEDAIAFIEPRLSEEAGAVLRSRDIRRILEWEMKYLQNPRVRPETDEPTVVAGINAARYVQERSLDRSHRQFQRAQQSLPLGVASNFRYWGDDRTIYIDRGKGAPKRGWEGSISQGWT